MTQKISRRDALSWLALTAASTLVACNTTTPETPPGMVTQPSQNAYKTAAPTPTPEDKPVQSPPTPSPTPPQASQVTFKAPENFILIQGGTFNMGSPESEAWRGMDETIHAVTLSDFYLSKYEVTQEEYQEIMQRNPSAFSGNNLPVENISWFEAIEYCNARSAKEGLTPVYTIVGQNVSWDQGASGYRLPTEAEWEYACRASTTTPFNTQTSISPAEANYYGRYPYEIENNYFTQGNLATKPGLYRQTTIKVGSFAPNQWGIHDMHGNVGEWCWDFYGPYQAEPQHDPTGSPSGSLRVNRGGGWNDFAKHLRSAYRAATPPNNRSFNLGFRVAVGTPPASQKVTAATDKVNKGSTDGKNLIVYFTWSGNTRGIAHLLRELTGADIFEIKLVKPYSTDYNTVLNEAQRDLNQQVRPALANQVQNMEQYNKIFLGYPNWWASIPMPIASFLEKYDFTGKTILPFCSHGGGRFGQSLTAIAKLAPHSLLTNALSITYAGGPNLRNEMSTWLSQNGISKP